jgi:hypothetical protein
LESAVLDGTIAANHALGAGAYLLVLLTLAFVVYGRVTGTGGDLA